MILDAGVLIAIDRRQESARAFLTSSVRTRTPLHTTAPVAAQVWRNGRTQAVLAKALRGIVVHPFAQDEIALVGEVLRDSKTTDVVDAHLVVVASRLGHDIVTADTDDMTSLIGALSSTVTIRQWVE